MAPGVYWLFLEGNMRPNVLGVLLGCLTAPLAAAPEAELKDETGKTIIRYVVEAPAGVAPAGTTDPARQVGLFLCFQEHDTPIDSDMFPVRQALWRLGLLDHYVLIAGAPQARKFGPADHEPIEKLIAWAKKTYPINPRRIYMYGKGEGGKISAEFAVTHPNLITAAIMSSWGMWLMPSELKEPIDFANSAPEIYMTVGHRDLAHHLTCVRDAYLRVKAKGFHVIYREFEDMGARSYYPPYNDDAIGWAVRLRNKNLPLSPEERKLLKPVSSGGYFPGLALVGGAPAGAVLQKLFESPEAAVRAAAAETCRHGWFGEATVAALAKLVADASPKVRQTAIRALGIHANWRSQAAQQALIRLAMDLAADPADRLSATDALGQAARLQVKGVRQDPPMFQALVSLLGDKNEPVRSTAAAILAPVYQPGDGNPRRRAPAGGWQQWLDEITAREAGYLKDYEVCDGRSGGGAEPVDLFCKGGPAVARQDPRAAFQYTLQAAEQGYVPAQAAVGLLYAVGKGVQQDYAEAGRWWVKAAEGGHVRAADHAANLYRNGEGVPRDRNQSEKWARFVAERQPPPVH
jgi:hypothetical protein